MYVKDGLRTLLTNSVLTIFQPKAFQPDRSEDHEAFSRGLSLQTELKIKYLRVHELQSIGSETGEDIFCRGRTPIERI